MMKYRSMILNMEDEVGARSRELTASGKGAATSKSVTEDGKYDSDDVKKFKQQIEANLIEAQKQLAEVKVDRDLARQDAVQMYEMMEMLKAKYSTLIGENKKQTEELVKSEAEKLEVARALVDMKLELSNVMETAEKNKFELSTEILSLKNSLLESEESGQIAEVVSIHTTRPLSDTLCSIIDCAKRGQGQSGGLPTLVRTRERNCSSGKIIHLILLYVA